MNILNEAYSESGNLTNKEKKQDNFLNKIKNSLCILKFSNKIAHGFLLEYDKGNNIPFYCLITNEQIKKEDINTNEIELMFGKESRKIKINEKEKSIESIKIINYNTVVELIEKERIFYNYNFANIALTIIEILKKDNINDDYFLSSNLDNIDNYNNLINKSIYFPKKLEENEISYFKNGIKSIKQNEFNFLNNDKCNNLGFPIFLDGSTSVLGIIIHDQEKNENIGYFIYPIVNFLKNMKIKGKKDYGIATYEGELKNGKREGYGKFTNKDGSYYYVGQC